MALFGMAVMIGPAVGPTLGGYIVDNFHWSWIFFINLPVGALGLFMVWRFVHEPEDVRAANAARAAAQRRNLDWIGIALLAVGLAALQFLLEEGQQKDWFESSLIVGCAAVTGGRARALRLARARGAGPGGERPAVQGPALRLRHRHRRGDVRDPAGLHVPPAGLHAGAARLHRDAVRPRAHAADARDDGGDALRRAALREVSARALIAVGDRVRVHGRLARLARHARDHRARDRPRRSWSRASASASSSSRSPPRRSRTSRARTLADATGLNSLLRQVGASMGLAVFATLLLALRRAGQGGRRRPRRPRPARGAGPPRRARRRVRAARARSRLGPGGGAPRAERDRDRGRRW